MQSSNVLILFYFSLAAAQYPVVIEVPTGEDQSLSEIKNALALPVSEAASAGENYPTILKINSGFFFRSF